MKTIITLGFSILSIAFGIAIFGIKTILKFIVLFMMNVD